jgi:hypothetical protein
MRAFRFVTQWSFRAPIERVFAEISACERYASWWRGFEKSEKREDIIGQRVRGILGMRLAFEQYSFTREPPSGMQFLSRGDLVGEGVWKLERDGQTTNVTLTWEVDLGRRSLRAVAKVPGMRALMKRSHDALMEKGRADLAARL